MKDMLLLRLEHHLCLDPEYVWAQHLGKKRGCGVGSGRKTE
jgi:hypothetical protein